MVRRALPFLAFTASMALGVAVEPEHETRRQADAESLLAELRKVLPERWGAQLFWEVEAPEKRSAFSVYDGLPDRWSEFLPGNDGRRIEIRRVEAIEFMVDAPGPDPNASYVRKETARPAFALTLGAARGVAEIRERLAELDAELARLERILKPSFYQRREGGSAHHSVPRDDAGRRALHTYDRLSTARRLFPQWRAGSNSVGFRSLSWVRRFPEEHQQEYRMAKAAVLEVLEPLPGWELIPADED